MLYQKYSFSSVFLLMHYKSHPLVRWLPPPNSESTQWIQFLLASVSSSTATPSLIGFSVSFLPSYQFLFSAAPIMASSTFILVLPKILFFHSTSKYLSLFLHPHLASRSFTALPIFSVCLFFLSKDRQYSKVHWLYRWRRKRSYLYLCCNHWLSVQRQGDMRN